MRLYGLTSPSFYIPHAVLPVDEVLARIGEPMERQLRADIARAFADLPDIGGTQIVIHGETYGAFLAHSPGQPWGGKDDLVLIDRWANLRLTHADALAFQHELDELFARYEHRSGPQSYSLHLRLVASARGRRAVREARAAWKQTKCAAAIPEMPVALDSPAAFRHA